MKRDEDDGEKSRAAVREMTVEQAADDLVIRLGEIGGIAYAIDRALYAEHGAEWDACRLAAGGLRRLVSLASDRAMALGDRIGRR